MVRELDRVVELNRLRSGFRTAFDVQAASLVEDLSEGAAGLALPEPRNELSHAVLRQEEVGRKCVGPNLDEIVTL
jgi:hypothetical protein